MHLVYRHRDRHITVEVRRADDGRFQLTVDGNPHGVEAELLDASTLYLVHDGSARTVRVTRLGDTVHVAIDGDVYVLTSDTGAAAGGDTAVLGSPQIVAPMPSKVLQVLVQKGQRVEVGDGLVILEAMKMENRILAEAPATIRKVHVTEGQMVDGGALLIELDLDVDADRA